MPLAVDGDTRSVGETYGKDEGRGMLCVMSGQLRQMELF